MAAIDWRGFLKSNPTLVAALLGSGTGAAVGGTFSDPGERGAGAVRGALLGGLAGTGGGVAAHGMITKMPSPETAMAYGALSGGTVGGYLGKKQLKPWLVQHLTDRGHGQKEAQMSQEQDLVKKAEMEKEAELNRAFDFGMDTYFANVGIDRAQLIKLANDKGAKVSDETLAEETILWVSKLLEEKK